MTGWNLPIRMFSIQRNNSTTQFDSTALIGIKLDVSVKKVIWEVERNYLVYITNSKKSKGVLRQAEVAQGVPGRLRPRIFSTFGTTRVVGRQPNAPAAFTPEEIPGTHFQRLSRPQGTWVLSEGTTEKIPSGTTGDRSRHRPTSSQAR
jgi:hypothetical protein